jgi:hypothetical protein
MKIICPKCGELIEVPGLGRKRLNIAVINIIDSLKATGSTQRTAEQLRCSKSYIFAVLKAQNLKLKDVIDSK